MTAFERYKKVPTPIRIEGTEASTESSLPSYDPYDPHGPCKRRILELEQRLHRVEYPPIKVVREIPGGWKDEQILWIKPDANGRLVVIIGS